MFVEPEDGFIYNCVMRTYRAVNLNVLWFLIALNVVIFVITLMRPAAVIGLLGLDTTQIQDHPWTVITSMFVHDPRLWTHILFNMIALYFLGSFLFRAVGERSFLVVFFLGGLTGNLLFILYAHLTDSPLLGYGASGGIFALAGALAAMVPRAPVIVFPIPIPMPLWAAAIILVLLSFVSYRIAWQAHLGGLALGLIAGLILKKRRRAYF